MTDPAAIDLMVEIEALRKRVAVKQTLIGLHKEADDRAMHFAETARAHEAELMGALNDISQSDPVDFDGNDDAEAGWSWCVERANIARAATPTAALERARARDEVVEKARSTIRWAPHKNAPSQFDFQRLVETLAKLDALDRPAKTGDGT